MPVMPRRLPRDDRGAVGTVFAILLAAGVLLGSLALVVDVGRIYAERSALSNGADAAALALARACATGAPECATADSLWELAEYYADENADDKLTTVETICGNLPDVLLPCDAQPANLTRCLGDPPPEPYVEVHVRTQTSTGTVLPPVFAQAVAGGNAGTTVGACARAAWGDLRVLGVTATMCQFTAAPGVETVIQFWAESVDECDTDPGEPWENPRQAGFLNEPGCQVTMSDDGVVSGSMFGFDPYDVAPEACLNQVFNAWDEDRHIYLPIHDGRRCAEIFECDEADDEDEWEFHHLYVAEFRITGYQLGAPPEVDPPYDPELYRRPSKLTGEHPCDIAGYRCIAGVFETDLIPISELNQVRLVG